MSPLRARQNENGAMTMTYAGEGPAPSTLAAYLPPSPSVSRRGEPAPDTLALSSAKGSGAA